MPVGNALTAVYRAHWRAHSHCGARPDAIPAPLYCGGQARPNGQQIQLPNLQNAVPGDSVEQQNPTGKVVVAAVVAAGGNTGGTGARSRWICSRCRTMSII